MHMAFLSRVFKNLQWYGMTKRKPLQLLEKLVIARVFLCFLCVAVNY